MTSKLYWIRVKGIVSLVVECGLSCVRFRVQSSPWKKKRVTPKQFLHIRIKDINGSQRRIFRQTRHVTHAPNSTTRGQCRGCTFEASQSKQTLPQNREDRGRGGKRTWHRKITSTTEAQPYNHTHTRKGQNGLPATAITCFWDCEKASFPTVRRTTWCWPSKISCLLSSTTYAWKCNQKKCHFSLMAETPKVTILTTGGKKIWHLVSINYQ